MDKHNIAKLQEEIQSLTSQKAALQDAVQAYREKPSDVQNASLDREHAFNYAEIDRLNSCLLYTSPSPRD